MPQNDRTRKGRILVEMKRRLRQAAESGKAKVLLCGPPTSSAPGGEHVVPSGPRQTGRTRKRTVIPGKRGIGRQWAYLPDVAETMGRFGLQREIEF